MSRLVAFPYYGGKHFHVKWLLSRLPKCHHYVEPFCGAAHVALNREPSAIETINDLNGELINFFIQLRNNTDELIAKLELTLYSRDELKLARQPCDDNIERARRWFVCRMQAFGALFGSKGWSYNVATPKSKQVSSWNNKIEQLPRLVARLRQFQIESKPAIDIIKRFDRPGTLFYCDPPYIQDSRVDKDSYLGYEMSDEDHRQLSRVLHTCEGKVAISGYRCELSEELYGSWYRYDKDTVSRTTTVGNNYPKRIESLWVNFKE